MHSHHLWPPPSTDVWTTPTSAEQDSCECLNYVPCYWQLVFVDSYWRRMHCSMRRMATSVLWFQFVGMLPQLCCRKILACEIVRVPPKMIYIGHAIDHAESHRIDDAVYNAEVSTQLKKMNEWTKYLKAKNRTRFTTWRRCGRSSSSNPWESEWRGNGSPPAHARRPAYERINLAIQGMNRSRGRR